MKKAAEVLRVELGGQGAWADRQGGGRFRLRPESAAIRRLGSPHRGLLSWWRTPASRCDHFLCPLLGGPANM